MVLQLCGRVCRRLSLWNPNLKRLGFFLFIGTTCSPNGSVRRLSLWNPNLKRLGFFLFIGTTCSPNGSVRRLCLARSANAPGLLENPVSVETVFSFIIILVINIEICINPDTH